MNSNIDKQKISDIPNTIDQDKYPDLSNKIWKNKDLLALSEIFSKIWKDSKEIINLWNIINKEISIDEANKKLKNLKNIIS